MKKDFIYELAQKFAPTYWASDWEKCHLVELENKKKPRILRRYPPCDPIIYFSAVPLNPREDCTAYEISYFTIWDLDTGGIFGHHASHQWDTERTAVLVSGPRHEKDLNGFSAKEAYYAAHEGAPLVNRSGFYPCTSEDSGVIVYWSLGKHASYPGLDKFPWFDMFRSPGSKSSPEKYALVDMGTLHNPKVPWILYEKRWNPAVPSICKKLKKRLWNKKTWQKIETHDLAEEHLKSERSDRIKEQIGWFQKITDQSPTGELDKHTIRKIWTENLDSHLVENFDKFSEEDSRRILHSCIRGSDVDFIAKMGLRGNEIEEIIQKNLHGKKMRKYVKGKISKQK